MDITNQYCNKRKFKELEEKIEEDQENIKINYTCENKGKNRRRKPKISI